MPTWTNVAGAYTYVTSAAPVAGNNEVQTIAANPNAGSNTGGTFKLNVGGEVTADIPYNATTAQLETALNNLKSLGAGGTAALGVAVTGGQLGTTVTITFSGTNVAQVGYPLIVLHTNAITGGGSLTIARTQTAVAATARGALPGALLVQDAGGTPALFQNTGSQSAPVWTTR